MLHSYVVADSNERRGTKQNGSEYSTRPTTQAYQSPAGAVVGLTSILVVPSAWQGHSTDTKSRGPMLLHLRRVQQK
jgi:hypothetical protein